MNFLKYVVLLALSIVLTACGGGGGNPGTSNGTTAPTPTPGVPTMTLFIYNSLGAKVYDVSSGAVFTARATLIDAAGAPVANKLVTFSNGAFSNLALTPLTSVTNASGIAEVTVSPSSTSTGGGVSLTASATVSSTATTAQVDFSVSASSVVTTPPVAKPTMTLFIYNASGIKVNYVSIGAVFKARAMVLDAAGVPVANKLVSFSNGGYTNVVLSPAAIATDAQGVAEVLVSPSTSSSGGGVSLTATATVNGTTPTAQVDFNVAAGSSSTAAPTLTVGIYTVGGTSPVNAVSFSAPFEVRATLLNASGVAVPNELVTFSMGAYTNAVVSPTSLVTNASGVAIVSIAPASISSVGGAVVTASAQVGVGGPRVSNQTSFNVASTNVSLSAITVGSASLASAGNTSLAVTVNINGVAASGVPINVTYTASCGRINGSGSSASVTTNGSGIASASYEAVNSDGTLCSGPVTVTASSASASSVSTSITVATATANAITYISPGSSVQIFVTGSGALEQYVAQFKVLSGTTAMANQSVTFSLLVNPGGVGLNSSGSTANVVATTNSAGIASVAIFSGTIPGPVKVRASLTSDTSVFAETQNVTVASGPPSQRFMSLSVETFNIEGRNIDGTATKLTARVADRQGNAVQDGTVVNFTAEGGQVAHSCATAQVNKISSCSVDFISQNPRPAGGRVSVLAYLEGTKDYIDINGNNRYDAGVDTLIQMGDAYRDDDENASYDSGSGEFMIPRGGSTACAGTGWPFPSRVNTCDSSLATTVRQQAVLLYSSSSPILTVTAPAAGVNQASASGISFKLNSKDHPLLPMPAGTTITAQASGQSIVLGATVYCSVDKIYGSTVANISPGSSPATDLGTQHQVTLKDCVAGAGHSVAVTITAPSGLATTVSYGIP